MLIREADKRDLPHILKLLGSMDGEGAMSLDNAEAIWIKIVEYPYYKTFLAEDEGRIVGTYSLIIIDNLGHLGSKLAVAENVIVSEDYRGKGIGSMMMKDAMERAAKLKCYKLMLSSNKKRTAAHEFYTRLGFEQHGISFMVEGHGG